MPEIFLTGPQGRIEAKYHHNMNPESPVAIVLPPNPQQGGTMNNRVVFSMYKTFAKAGFSVLRFNHAGVGKSIGEVSDNGVSQVEDAMAMLNWIQEQNPQASGVWVCGFSFGAWVALQLLMRRPEIEKFVLLSPPVAKLDFNFLAPYPCKGLVIQGNMDTYSPEIKTAGLVSELNDEKNIEVDYKIIDGANHYYPDKYEGLLVNTLNEYIKKHT